MSGYQLGQRVTFSDRLVRVTIGGYPEDLLQEAMNLMSIPRKRGVTTHRGLDWKLWVPATFARAHLHKGLCMISSLADPGTNGGVIVQSATLQQGGTDRGSYDNEACWMGHGTTRAYKVAFSLNRNPIHVLPEHIALAEAQK